MTTYSWKILGITSEDDVITHAEYLVTATHDDEVTTISTQGNWWFSDKILKIPFKDVTEQNIADWIEKESIQDGISTIKSNLDKQLSYLKEPKKSSLPWNPQTFKLKI